MTSKTLQKARDYEVKMEEKIAEESRPAFHLSARVGWMMIQMDFLTTMGNTICSISIIRMMHTGDQCTGDMQ